jgi:hypothetical protein
MSPSTHTFVKLEISAEAFEEIAARLRAAGYYHVFKDENQMMDMQGIALIPERANAEKVREKESWWPGRRGGPE